MPTDFHFILVLKYCILEHCILEYCKVSLQVQPFHICIFQLVPWISHHNTQATPLDHSVCAQYISTRSNSIKAMTLCKIQLQAVMRGPSRKRAQLPWKLLVIFFEGHGYMHSQQVLCQLIKDMLRYELTSYFDVEFNRL